jgi:hypothetical protein
MHSMMLIIVCTYNWSSHASKYISFGHAWIEFVSEWSKFLTSVILVRGRGLDLKYTSDNKILKNFKSLVPNLRYTKIEVTTGIKKIQEGIIILPFFYIILNSSNTFKVLQFKVSKYSFSIITNFQMIQNPSTFKRNKISGYSNWHWHFESAKIFTLYL